MGYSSDLTSQLTGAGHPKSCKLYGSHDEERIMYKTITYGAATVDYNTQNLKVALKECSLLLSFSYSTGAKMIWQFGSWDTIFPLIMGKNK